MNDSQVIDWLSMFMAPRVSTVTSRTSSVTNAFVNAIIPRVLPTAEEVQQAFEILGMTSGELECSYCGDPASEWDHLRPIVRDKRPTGYITEIRNLVPACGKCNQSKGAVDWRGWMTGPAKRSPRSRGIADIPLRMERLEAFEAWGRVEAIKLEDIVPSEDLDRHWDYLERVVVLMAEAQEHAKILRDAVANDLAERGSKHQVVLDAVPEDENSD